MRAVHFYYQKIREMGYSPIQAWRWAWTVAVANHDVWRHDPSGVVF